MLAIIRKIIRKNHFLRVLVGQYIPATGIYDRFFRNYNVSDTWRDRIHDVIKCDDNDKIPRVENAGKIINGKQIMHNGCRVNVGSYYGPEVARLLIENRGVHEPQEEYVFLELLQILHEDAVMIELGAFWAFYSLWFGNTIKNAVNFMIEPDRFNIISGKRNFRLNNLRGDFTNAFISDRSIDRGRGIRTICIDDFVVEKSIKHINLLHSDIQGFELDMLKGATKCLIEGKIDYIFISTHSNQLHYDCIRYLDEYNYRIVVESDLDNTFSEDGLIVAKRGGLPGLENIKIDKKSKK